MTILIILVITLVVLSVRSAIRVYLDSLSRIDPRE